MIDDTTIDAFGDELAKIAGLLGSIGQTARKWVSTGWNKPAGLFEKAVHTEGALKGKKIMDAAGKQVWHERPDATWLGRGVSKEPGIHRFGDITRALPVGDKSILTGLTAASAPAALRKEDDAGMERSRSERISGLAGGTVGSLLGMGAAAHIPSFRGTGPMKSWGIARAIAGGLAGGILGEHMASNPFKKARAQMPQMQNAPQQQIPNEVIA